MGQVSRMADIKSLEHPTLKVPYEILNKRFRSAQKVVDREVRNSPSLCYVKLETVVGSVVKYGLRFVEVLCLLCGNVGLDL